ncbi:stage IV sporulation protein A, partial [Staphylococcus aureus]
DIRKCEYIQSAELGSIELGSGLAKIALQTPSSLFYRILGEKTGIEIHDEGTLFRSLQELSAMKKEYEKIRQAYDDVRETGYG